MADVSTSADDAVRALDFTTFHRDEVRHDVYPHPPQAPFFDESIGMWIVLDPFQALEMIAAPGMEAVAINYQQLERRFGLDLTALHKVLADIPLYLRGEAHQRTRRRIFDQLVARRPQIQHWIAHDVETFLRPLTRPGRVEVMSEIVRPMIYSLIGVISGIDIDDAPPVDQISLLFDGSISFRRRLEVFDQVEALRAHVSTVHPDYADADVNLQVILAIFGRDPLGNTLGESLKWLIEKQPGVSFANMTYPDSPPEPGVPFVERSATQAVDILGVHIAAGDRLRIFTQGFGYLDGMTELHRFFGARAHVCPGRPVSVDLWRQFTRVLARADLVPRIVGTETRTDNYIFTGPETLLLDIEPSAQGTVP